MTSADPQRREIPIRTREDLWTFTERQIPLWDILDFFPTDSVGSRSANDTPRPYEVKPITIETDLGFEFDTDIQYGAWRFRPRSPRAPSMGKWCRERGLEVGDRVVFEKLGERRFRVSLEKGEPEGPGGP